MKHYVLGFVFNRTKEKVLLIRKNKPNWQADKWNGIGGKIEDEDQTPYDAMQRESYEETGNTYNWIHCVTFICPGGTVFVYRAFDYMNCHCEVQCNKIHFKQIEDELLKVWRLDNLPDKVDRELHWLIPICLSSIQFPINVYVN